MSQFLDSIDTLESQHPDLAEQPVPIGLTRYWGVGMDWPERVWEGTPYTAATLPEDLVPLRHGLRLVANFIDHAGEETLLRRLVDWPFVPHEDLVVAAPDLDSALEAVARRLSLTNRCLAITGRRRAGAVRIRVDIEPAIGALRGFMEITTLIFLLRLVTTYEGLAGKGLKDRAPIHGKAHHASTDLVAIAQRLTDTKFRVASSAAELAFDPAYLSLPNPGYRAQPWQTILAELHLQPGGIPALDETALRQLIRDSLLRDRRPPQMATLAAQRGTSVRSLARGMAEQGLSLRDLVNAVRMEMAREYLVERASPVSAVASSLGYSDTASFTRTFRRNFGVPPGQWRAAAGARTRS